jgi:hypothetical protein
VCNPAERRYLSGLVCHPDVNIVEDRGNSKKHIVWMLGVHTPTHYGTNNVASRIHFHPVSARLRITEKQQTVGNISPYSCTARWKGMPTIE